MKNLFVKGKEKVSCKRGEQYLGTIILIIAVVLIGVLIYIPRSMKTSEKQADKVDNKIEEMWGYKN